MDLHLPPVPYETAIALLKAENLRLKQQLALLRRINRLLTNDDDEPGY